jgi:glycosyltransferase involved in cell wall biosynthesis
VSRPSALVLTPRLPWPLDDGGRIGLYQTVWSVAREYDTTLVSIVPEDEAEWPVPEALSALGVETIRVGHRPPWTPFALARGALGRWPYMLERYRNARYDATLRRLVAERRPRFALVNHLHMATYLDALGGVPAVLRAHNLEHLWLERYAGRVTNPAVRAYALDQVRRMERAEADLFSRCALVLAIQDEEGAAIRALAPGTRVETIPLGIDVNRYRARAPESPSIVALIGSWDWAPNADGGRVFLERGWPRVRDAVPGARLRLLGKRMSPLLAQAARRVGAEAVGYVDDMSVEFARAAVMVVPLWMGSGVRVKIVEGLAARVPVATTTIGAEGLGLEPGVHATFAESPEDLGDAIAGLLRDPERARATAEAGCAFVTGRYSLDAVGRRTLELCRAVAGAAAGAAAGDGGAGP